MVVFKPSDVSDLVTDFLNGKNKTCDVAVYNDNGEVVVDYF